MPWSTSIHIYNAAFGWTGILTLRGGFTFSFNHWAASMAEVRDGLTQLYQQEFTC